ncbi:flotillin [Brevundimonas phage vB_BpoS-Marchewka]|uniref:Flotillin n=1 Tax=Brevundimonas phage vB_BpoS-Marchewka TaxID=2948604 RepID=A0A9E7SSM3_9CAUD|nr:flotillin [Brevundimonas phage vB_BpoS-Marchewka]UTC29415.1 flotillin protein [Brevundimonas phage vB_BpoS-Bambus]
MPFVLIGGAVFGVILVLALLVALMLRRVVPTNMVHIVQRGKTTISYGKGKEAGNVYYEWPQSVPALGVTVTRFPESVFDVSLANYEAYDIGRLPFVVDIVAFYRVENSETAAQRVASFDELQQQLKSVLQGAVRTILSTNKLEEIMQDRAKLGTEFTAEVNHQLQEWGVTTVKSIEFMDIRDSSGSKVIANMMAKEQSRIEKESRITVAENLREAELKEIDADRVVEVQKQDAQQQLGIRTAEKERAVGIADEQTRQEVLLESKLTAERQMDVQKINDVKTAEIAKDVAIVKAEQDREVLVVKSEAEKRQTVIAAEAQKERTEVVAQGDLAAAQNQAQGLQAIGEAKAKAEEAILMAPVTAQITLAKEIGENQPYQQYLITVEQIKAGQAVGTEMAQALKSADLKVIANAGDVQSGVASLGGILSPAGGTAIAGALSALSQLPEGKALVERLTGVDKAASAG